MTPDGPWPSPRSGQELRTLAVTPVHVEDPGGGRRSAAVALVALVAVLAVGIGVARLTAPAPIPVAPRAVVGTSTGSPASATSSPPPPTASPSPRQLPLPARRFGRDEVMAAIATGELDGSLLLVAGKLEAIPLPCDREPDALHTCVLMAIENLDIPVQAGAITLPWHDDPPPGDYLVTVPWKGTLWYLGHLPPRSSTPLTIDGLTRDLLRQGAAGAPQEMFLVEGWLAPGQGTSCPSASGLADQACTTLGPFLADELPADDGTPRNTRGYGVLLGDAVGFDPSAAVVEGPFLVAMLTAGQCATRLFADACATGGARWVVEAAYPGDAALVVLPGPAPRAPSPATPAPSPPATGSAPPSPAGP